MKVYQIEFFNLNTKSWQNFKFVKNLKKAYEKITDEKTGLGKPKATYWVINRALAEESEESENQESKSYDFEADVISVTPHSARIDGKVKVRISKHYVE